MGDLNNDLSTLCMDGIGHSREARDKFIGVHAQLSVPGSPLPVYIGIPSDNQAYLPSREFRCKLD
jgi:hypothetical protein